MPNYEEGTFGAQVLNIFVCFCFICCTLLSVFFSFRHNLVCNLTLRFRFQLWLLRINICLFANCFNRMDSRMIVVCGRYWLLFQNIWVSDFLGLSPCYLSLRFLVVYVIYLQQYRQLLVGQLLRCHVFGDFHFLGISNPVKHFIMKLI